MKGRRLAGPETAGILFVTGTGTGAGKTVLTALLLDHLRRRGVAALAMKPFSAGGLGDALLFSGLQAGELPLDELNPFRFASPVAPLAAARAEGVRVALADAVGCVSRVARRCAWLLVEGAGGLLSPLGEGFTAVEMIRSLECGVVVAARDELGVVNQALLTLRHLETAGRPAGAVALMGKARPDDSAAQNAVLIEEWSRGVPVARVPWIGRNCRSAAALGAAAARGGGALERAIEAVLQGCGDHWTRSVNGVAGARRAGSIPGWGKPRPEKY